MSVTTRRALTLALVASLAVNAVCAVWITLAIRVKDWTR